MAKISVRHALLPEELDFCRRHVALNEQNPKEAYRRSFLVRGSGTIVGPASEHGWCDKDSEGGPLGEPLTAGEINKRVKKLLAQAHVQSYIEELKRSGGELARQNLLDTVLFGDPNAQARARDTILQEEDKLGFRDAVAQWATIMCAIGTEVRIPLPDGTEAAVPLARLMPEEIDFRAPEAVRKKTAASLRAFADVIEQGGPDLKLEE